MFERFTTTARDLVARARAEAVSTGAAEIGPAHLLAALLMDPTCEGVAVLESAGADAPTLLAELRYRRTRYVDGLDEDDADALRALGIDLDEVVRRVDRHLGAVPPSSHSPRFSRPAKQALGLALREAVRLGADGLGTDHLLLGTVGVGDRLVGDTLGACGVAPSRLRCLVSERARRAG